MPTQTINFDSVDSSTYNGSEVSSIILNGSQIWEAASGPVIAPTGFWWAGVEGSVLTGPFAWAMWGSCLYVDATTNSMYAVEIANQGMNAFGNPISTGISSAKKTLNGYTVTQNPIISFDSNGNLINRSVQNIYSQDYDSYNNLTTHYIEISTSNNVVTANRNPPTFGEFNGNNANGKVVSTWNPSTLTWSHQLTPSDTGWNLGVQEPGWWGTTSAAGAFTWS